jgi:hypothetical protein
MTRAVALFLVLCSTSLFFGCGGSDNKPAPSKPAVCDPKCGPTETCYQGACLLKRTVPDTPVCYTPCTGGPGCSQDGLYSGCIGDNECKNGTCMPKQVSGRLHPLADTGAGGEGNEPEPGTCAKEADCPDFQACIEGTCYSDCEADADCKDTTKFVCSRKVCRERCTAGGSECREGHSCKLDTATTGVCMPLPSAGKGVAAPTGSFSIDDTDLRFTTTHVSDQFVIENDSSEAERFTISKIQHTEYSATGSKLVTDDPLSWLDIEVDTGTLEAGGVTVVVDAGAKATVKLAGAADGDGLERWDGRLRVAGDVLGEREVLLHFSGTREGHWNGTLYYMASNFGEVGLDQWLSHGKSSAGSEALGNAFIRRWVAFREGRLSRREFEAMLQATETGSWAYDSVKAKCPEPVHPDPNTGCYLSDVPGGVSIFSESLPDAPIPSGITKFPMAVNVRADAHGDGFSWSGKVVSDTSLLYPGDPTFTLGFGADPNDCDGKPGGCVVPLTQMSFDVALGGRFFTDAKDRSCSGVPGFSLVQTPWLIDGFSRNTSKVDGVPYRFSCRDGAIPLGDDPSTTPVNLNLAGSNPIPDGVARLRHVELIDGGMIDGDSMFIIFRETMPSFFGMAGQDVKGYGFMWLKREAQNLVEADYEGSTAPTGNTEPMLGGTTCASWIFDKLKATGGPSKLDSTTVNEVGTALVTGASQNLGAPLDDSAVHSLCVSSSSFDDSACPDGSRVIYFTGDGQVLDADSVKTDDCNSDHTCNDTFNDWIKHSKIRADLVYQCPAGLVTCPGQQIFYLPGKDAPAFPSLDAAIQDAFRYKTQFQNRQGTSSVGFAPGICTDDPKEVPYCYDPAEIEEIADRVDCAVHIYTSDYDDLDDATRELLADFLVRNFSYSDQGGKTLDGFERLYAELLVMLGDESYSSAFTARFDLAGQALKTFSGALFEPNGINLTGAAGYEMWHLYQAAQYYQMALDRFYAHTLDIQNSLTLLPPGQSFITQATASSYFDRLLQASSQRSRAFGEIAKRYQSFRQPDLARLVVSRTYGQTYLESVVLSTMLRDLSATAAAADKAQIDAELTQAQLNNQVGLLDLATVNDSITDDATVFGYSPEYIPFAALDKDDKNAFEKFFAQAQDSAKVAADKETAALNDTRSYNVSQAQFQETLTGIQVDYESQLSDICGTFVASGKVYPAITRYADLTDNTRALGDPCGFVGNGRLYDAILGLDKFNIASAALQQKLDDLKQSITEANDRASKECSDAYDVANWKINNQAQQNAISDAIDIATSVVEDAATAAANCKEVNEALKCAVGTSTDCPSGVVTAAANAAIDAAIETLQKSVTPFIKSRISDLRNLTEDQLYHDAEDSCDAAKLDLHHTVFGIAQQISDIEISADQAQIDINLALSQVTGLQHQAKALIANEEQANSLAINTAAAFTDPNVRIYKNDSIIAAERTFDSAVRDAYLATKAYEYYTSQSYDALAKLFLIRMVNYGDFPLDQYLRDLDDAYQSFQMEFGNPQERVLVVSLRDDILSIPRLGGDNRALTQEARQALFRKEIAKSRYRDANGALVFPFGTSVDKLSPRTFDHKVDYAEAEIVPKVGDDLARVYIVQKGTGVVRDATSTLLYYSLPERTAVVDTFFAGTRTLGDDVYQNDRLHDRPVANTDWELQVSLTDEDVNSDLDPSAIDDIRLYFYYTDFTP